MINRQMRRMNKQSEFYLDKNINQIIFIDQHTRYSSCLTTYINYGLEINNMLHKLLINKEILCCTHPSNKIPFSQINLSHLHHNIIQHVCEAILCCFVGRFSPKLHCIQVGLKCKANEQTNHEKGYRSQMNSKCAKSKKVAQVSECVTDVLPTCCCLL